MLKDAPIGSPIFHIYNVLYLTIFTGLMTFGMLFVYYITYEPPNHLKDIEKMLGKDASKYTIIEDNLVKEDFSNLEEINGSPLKSYFNGYSFIRRFYVTDKVTNEPLMTVFDLASGGFGGLIWSLIGIDGTQVKAISIYNVASETAGLGQRTAEAGFQRQFLNKTKDQLPTDRTQWGNGIDMISGATFSSSAVVTSIIKAFNLYNLGVANEEE